MCKKLIYLVSFVLVLSLAGSAQAAHLWTNDTGTGIWNDANNWSGGVVPSWDDVTDVGIDQVPGPIVQSAGMGAHRINMTGTSDLTIDGGTLDITTHLQVASAKGAVATVTINSGTLTVGMDTNMGLWGTGTLNMNGGTLTAARDMRVGTAWTSTGRVNLDGGIITVAEIFVMAKDEGSVGTMDITAGTLIIDGDAHSLVQAFIGYGWITAYDGSGSLLCDYDITNAGKTTLKTDYFFDPIPANGLTVPVTFNLLQWTLPETGPFGGAITCNVYFGTNPSIWENLKIVNRQAVESVSVTLTPDTTYYWAIALFDSGSSTPDEPYMWWPVFTFNTYNVPPIVNAGDDVESWLVDEDELIDGNIPPDANRVVQLDGIVTDDGFLEPCTVLWTVVSEPNSVTHPAVISDPYIVNPTITMTALPGLYELELAAYDGQYTVSDTMVIQLYDTSCEHARNQEGFEWFAGDVNHDCKVDFLDFADFAATWLQENPSTE